MKRPWGQTSRSRSRESACFSRRGGQDEARRKNGRNGNTLALMRRGGFVAGKEMKEGHVARASYSPVKVFLGNSMVEGAGLGKGGRSVGRPADHLRCPKKKEGEGKRKEVVALSCELASHYESEGGPYTATAGKGKRTRHEKERWGEKKEKRAPPSLAVF